MRSFTPSRPAEVERSLSGGIEETKLGICPEMNGSRTLNNLNRRIIPDILRLDTHVYTLYLVTASDFVSVLLPQTMFSIFACMSTHFTTNHKGLSVIDFLPRLHLVVAWIWLQLLVLDLANQRLPDSVAEDEINKPWRPIPSKRLSRDGARQLLVVSIVLTLAFSTYTGSIPYTLVLFLLNWLYNDLGLANDHWVLRNLLNALGITSIGAGATQVAFGPDYGIDAKALHKWWLLCAGMILTTIHGQDLYDQEGDAKRCRKTAPLVLGDNVARWTILVPVLAWSGIMPASLGMRPSTELMGCLLPILFGCLVSSRLLFWRTVQADKTTFKCWATWSVCLYALPLFKSME